MAKKPNPGEVVFIVLCIMVLIFLFEFNRLLFWKVLLIPLAFIVGLSIIIAIICYLITEYKKQQFNRKKRELVSSDSYNHLVNFARHKETHGESGLIKLKKLLNKKGFQFNEVEIQKLIEYENFKDKVTSNAPRNFQEYCENFIKSYGDEYLKYKKSFVELLKEENVDFNQREIDETLKQTKEEIEIADLETELASKKTITVSGEDIDKLTGHKFEHFLRNLFEKMGYTVGNTKLSGDQGADLIVSKAGEKIVVQAKKHANKVTNRAIQEIVAAIKHYNADKGMVVTNNFFTRSAIELAKSNNIELIDRDKLKDLLKTHKYL